MLLVDKEILTPEKLQRVMRELAAVSFIFCLLLAPCLFLSLYIFVEFKFHIIFTFFLAACAATVGVIFAVLLTNGAALFIRSFRNPVVVIATRVSSGSKKISLWCRFMHQPRHDRIIYIHFHGYGAHPSTSAMLESTSPGDKFYLLLDKFDHIVDYYPCNDYEYTGELTPSKYEK